jgi:hypothetical protein
LNFLAVEVRGSVRSSLYILMCCVSMASKM